uniref:Uncharacterized protein n=1 Tax=Chromera velia CCMP2878 TaxID=1169474 RepID=A0A0G4IDV5_9ALVE|mmetsp:Transcript_19440/g.39116  ORF Transcript_19440/g.39116 Transcript_19440/m.39116 type:complete len:463 (+) Transcript_19440:168-1556(+)|eukprot:Cvel_13404.t1-p1 / transcript=Cvel_13404.t1 / gene=Cvel_13404 / organism=Chromera_velia_CCMP2878 / gene_product=Uncharacterized WD repeat-containing protein, putative / transcript_product=Uncharacterized WD repeat-containing protein, putative / location=Cvel_scaffold913:56057-59799(+) / protein_length=462 / sequence_SO=supercontig / SO=protein_coding / is_pseudo=false
MSDEERAEDRRLAEGPEEEDEEAFFDGGIEAAVINPEDRDQGDFSDDEEGEDEDDADGADGAEEEEMLEPVEVDLSRPDFSLKTFDMHTDAVVAVALSKTDPQMIVTGACDDKAFLVCVQEEEGGVSGWGGKTKVELGGHSDTVSCVAFGFDGKHVATGGYDGVIRVWDVASGSLVSTLEGPSEEVEWIDWHPRGHALIAGSSDATTWLWWATTGTVMQVFAGHGASVTCGKFGKDGRIVCTGSADGSAGVFNPKTGDHLHLLKREDTPGWHRAGIVSLDTHKSLPLMATGAENGGVRVVNTDSGKVVAALENHERSVESVAFGKWDSSTGNVLLATASLEGTVNVVDCSSYGVRCTLKHGKGPDGSDVSGRLGPVVRMKWSPCGRPFLLTASTDGTLRFWDGRSGECIRLLSGHTAGVLDCDLQVADPREGRGTGDVVKLRAVSGGDDKKCKVWELEVPAH